MNKDNKNEKERIVLLSKQKGKINENKIRIINKIYKDYIIRKEIEEIKNEILKKETEIKTDINNKIEDSTNKIIKKMESDYECIKIIDKENLEKMIFDNTTNN